MKSLTDARSNLAPWPDKWGGEVGELAKVFQHVEDERERRQDATPALLAQLEAVVDYRLTWEGNTFAVGASIGLVRVDGAFSDAKEVLAAAGNACYTAKHQGRNRVVVFGE